MRELEHHFTYLTAALAAAQAAPLSARKAMLVVMLIDAYVDRLFAQSGEDDILRFREAMAAQSPALRLVMELAAHRDGGPRLMTEAVEVPLADYPGLSEADFMVGLYNGNTVQRVRVASADGARRDVHELLAEAVEELRSFPA